MSKYREWSKGRSRLDSDGTFKNTAQCESEAFKAGMLAAADITEAIDLSCDEFVTLEMIAEEIRMAANG
jgi:hypothetical protein